MEKYLRFLVPSMEVCGIDVFATVRANNLEIHTLKSNEEIKKTEF